MEKTECCKLGRQSNRQEQTFDVIMEQGEPFWLDLEHEISEWQKVRFRKLNMNKLGR